MQVDEIRRLVKLVEESDIDELEVRRWWTVVRILKRGTNMNRTIEDLKERGFWIYGLDERATATHFETDFAKPTALVLGSEGKGLHEHTRKLCDVLIRIPMAGPVASLNVSVAAGVVLYEWVRRTSESSTKE